MSFPELPPLLKRTLRHVNRLIELGIIKCQRFWGPNRKWGINKYMFKIKWQKPAQAFSDDKMAPIFPGRLEEEKTGSLRSLEEGKEIVLSWLTPGSLIWRLAGGGEA